MKATGLFIAITVIALLFAACNKNEVSPPKNINFNASYTGTFVYSNTDPAANYVPLKGNITIVFSGKGYTATSPLSMYAASAKGVFSTDYNLITFADSTVHPANFDWGIILNGIYSSTTKGDSLFLTKKASTSTYTYKLLKSPVTFSNN